MRSLIAILAAAVLWAAAAPETARAEEPGDSIEAVIADQIEAFRSNALERAFSHAAPGIQERFQTPQGFGVMVQSGYPMIWRPSRYEWAGLEKGPRGWVQTVLIEDAAGQLYEADYLMREIDGRWRIAGVSLRKVPGAVS